LVSAIGRWITDNASFETRLIGALRMTIFPDTIILHLILRRPRSGRLEGREAPVQRKIGVVPAPAA
jgi:hypothetical protein